MTLASKLERFHRSLRDKRQADRIKMVIALSKGWSAAQIAEILLSDEKKLLANTLNAISEQPFSIT